MRRRNKRRAKSAESTTSKIRQDDEDEQCRSTDVHIGCSSMDQNEVIMAQSCKNREIGIFSNSHKKKLFSPRDKNKHNFFQYAILFN